MSTEAGAFPDGAGPLATVFFAGASPNARFGPSYLTSSFSAGFF